MSRAKTFVFKFFEFDNEGDNELFKRMLASPNVGYMHAYIDERVCGTSLVGFVQFRSLMSRTNWFDFVEDRENTFFSDVIDGVHELVRMRRFVKESEVPVKTFEAGDVRYFSCGRLRAGTKRQKCFVDWWNGKKVVQSGNFRKGMRLGRHARRAKTRPACKN